MTSYLKSVREWATPTLKSSAFLSRGVLTPEEFVAAGDELVYKCPTWSWEGGDPKKAKSYLPPDKQVSFVGPCFWFCVCGSFVMCATMLFYNFVQENSHDARVIACMHDTCLNWCLATDLCITRPLHPYHILIY